MLCGLAADKRTACLYAALCHARNYLCYLFGIVLSAGYVVKEELRLCSAADDVVYAHSHAVDTYRVVLVKQKSYLYLCAYAVSARYKHRLVYARHIKLKKSAKAAYAVENALCDCPCNVLLHKLDCLVTCGNVNSRVLVAVRIAVIVHISYPFVVCDIWLLFAAMLFTVPTVCA